VYLQEKLKKSNIENVLKGYQWKETLKIKSNSPIGQGEILEQ
jgi:hypothetical protein